MNNFTQEFNEEKFDPSLVKTEESIDFSSSSFYEFPSSAPFYPYSSSSSSSERKRPRCEVEEEILKGNLIEKKHNEHFNIVWEGDKKERFRCRKCLRLLSSGYGGHLTMHRAGKCSVNAVVMKKRTSLNLREMNTALNDSIIQYLMESGSSFDDIASNSFKTLIREIARIVSPDLDLDSIQFPDSETIRANAEEKADEIISKISDEIWVPVKEEEACIFLGNHWPGCLSIFLVYIDRSKTEPRIKAVPFAFYSVISGTEDIVEMITEAGEKFDLSREDLIKLRVVGDGAEKLGDTFKSYPYCPGHSVQKVAERVLDPLEESLYSSEELRQLKDLQDLMELCGSISTKIRRLQNNSGISKLPTVPCSTRWLTFFYCAKDINEMFEELKNIKDLSVLVNVLEPQIPKLKTLISLMEPFECPLKRFEESDVKYHEMAPVLHSLLKYYKKEEAMAQNDCIRKIVVKSASISLENYIQTSVSKTHLMATFLCAGLKRLSSIPSEDHDKTIGAIRDELMNVSTSNDDGHSSSPMRNNKMDLINSLYDAPTPSNLCELDDYTNMPVTAEERSLCPLRFWIRHAQRFPRLSKLANSVHCGLASESVCERVFNHLDQVFQQEQLNSDPIIVEKLMISYLYLNDFI